MGDVVELGVRIDLKRTEELLRIITYKAIDLSPVLDGPVDARVGEFFEKQFSSRGSEGGVLWDNPSPFTLKMRQRPGHGMGGDAPLEDTRHLYRSFAVRDADASVRVVEPQYYARGSQDPNAAKQQEVRFVSFLFGRRLKVPKRVPARPIVPPTLPAPLVADIDREIADYIVTQV